MTGTFVFDDALLKHEGAADASIRTEKLVHDELVVGARSPSHDEDHEDERRPVRQENLAAMQSRVDAVLVLQDEDAGIRPIIQWIVRGSLLWPSGANVNGRSRDGGGGTPRWIPLERKFDTVSEAGKSSARGFTNRPFDNLFDTLPEQS